MEKVGFLGLGIMGAPMALNLLQAKVPLTVSDLNPDAVHRLVSAGAAQGTNREIAETSDIIITILPNGTVVKEVLLEMIPYLRPGQIVCDMSSVTPYESRQCADRLNQLQVAYMDAPVSGGEPGAKSGTLAIMCGGEQADFDRLLPVFHILGNSATLVGGIGCGSIAKLANQIIVNLNIAALSEALVFAAKVGADPEKVFHAISSGLAGSTVMRDKAPMMLEHNFVPGGKIAINLKDIRNAVGTAHEYSVPIPMSEQLLTIMEQLAADGHLGDDRSGIIQYFEQMAGIDVSKSK